MYIGDENTIGSKAVRFDAKHIEELHRETERLKLLGAEKLTAAERYGCGSRESAGAAGSRVGKLPPVGTEAAPATPTPTHFTSPHEHAVAAHSTAAAHCTTTHATAAAASGAEALFELASDPSTDADRRTVASRVTSAVAALQLKLLDLPAVSWRLL